MSIYALKPKFQALLRPLVRYLAARDISANGVTLGACALSVLTGLLLSLGLYYGYLASLWLLPVFLFLRMAMNAIDGMLAREHQQQSALGGYLNELTDVVSDVALYLPLCLLPNMPTWLVVLMVLQTMLTEFAGILGSVHGNSRRYDGPMGKSDRAFWIAILALVWFGFPAVLQYNATILVVLNVLLALTTYRRIQKGLQDA